MTPIFREVLSKIEGLSEFDSVATLMEYADRLTTNDFHLLLGRAIRQPELLTPRFERAVGLRPDNLPLTPEF